jgi:hypothetical protein
VQVAGRRRSRLGGRRCSMTYLEHTIEMVNAFEDSCLCREIEQAEIDRMRNNEPLMRPASRFAYYQMRLMVSIAESLQMISGEVKKKKKKKGLP